MPRIRQQLYCERIRGKRIRHPARHDADTNTTAWRICCSTMRCLVEAGFPKAERITVVMDNLSIPAPERVLGRNRYRKLFEENVGEKREIQAGGMGTLSDWCWQGLVGFGQLCRLTRREEKCVMRDVADEAASQGPLMVF